jgi:hypothetical protein
MIGFMHFTKIILLLATYEEKKRYKTRKRRQSGD